MGDIAVVQPSVFCRFPWHSLAEVRAEVRVEGVLLGEKGWLYNIYMGLPLASVHHEN